MFDRHGGEEGRQHRVHAAPLSPSIKGDGFHGEEFVAFVSSRKDALTQREFVKSIITDKSHPVDSRRHRK